MILLIKKKIKNSGPEFSSMYFLISELHLLACKLSDLSLQPKGICILIFSR